MKSNNFYRYKTPLSSPLPQPRFPSLPFPTHQTPPR